MSKGLTKDVLEQEPLLNLKFDLGYQDSLLITYEDARVILGIFSKAKVFTRDWNDTDTKLNAPDEKAFTITPMDMGLYLNILKAQMLGITYKEFLDETK